MATSVKSLEKSVAKAILSNLGRLANSIESRFSCGGTISSENSTTTIILYKKQTGDWSHKPLQLPQTPEDDGTLQDLIDSCSPASFGLGNEAVTDKSYRDALKLEPDSFSTNFSPFNSSVIDYVTTLMKITSPVRAELYKLNIYSTGGHFKSHVDTPRSGDMFGSLVVCLPSPFTGGQLVTRHQQREVTFDWSNQSTSNIQWASFFSNVEHEVLPVTSGHRITLTYNLYHAEPMENKFIFHVSSNPLYLELMAAIRNPHFMRKGGILGFYCHHRYVDVRNDLDKFAHTLKGEDAIIYRIAKSLGLHIGMKSVCGSRKHDHASSHESDDPRDDPDYNLEEDDDRDRNDDLYILDNFHGFYDDHHCWGDDDIEILEAMFGVVVRDIKITWCRETKNGSIWEAAGNTAYLCGNDPVSLTFYQCACLLIVIPEFTSARSVIGSVVPTESDANSSIINKAT
jgi:hypothetical protein